MKIDRTEILPLKDSKRLSRLQQGHNVQFYTTTNELIKPLSKLINFVLQKNETFIVIATHDHLQALEMAITDSGINIVKAVADGLYIALEATQILDTFMVDDLPDEYLFNKVIGRLLENMPKQGQTVHAYGEMVAVLWKQGNQNAVLQLEEYWNKLLAKMPVSLYCAYPALHFTTYSDVLEQIRDCHRFNFSKLITN